MIDRSQVFGPDWIEALAQWERELSGEDSTRGMPSFDFTDWWLEARHYTNAEVYSDSSCGFGFVSHVWPVQLH